MTRTLLFFLLVAQSAIAQQGTKIETFIIHEAKEDDEDLSSNFPIVHTGTTTAEAVINKSLQARFFGHILDDNTKRNVQQNFAPNGNQVFSFTNQITDRFIGIVIQQYHVNNAMSLNGYDQHLPFLFDARTGKQFSPLALFSDDGVLLFLGKAFHALRDSYNNTMDRYIEGFSKMKAAAQAQQCDCDCEGVLQDAFRNNTVTFQFSKESINLSMDACSWQNPGPHDLYAWSIPMNDVRLWLSDYGKYMIDGGNQTNAPSTTRYLYQGNVGTIALTFILHQADSKLTGTEIYNRIGEIIKLQGSANGTQYIFDELSPDGKVLATFQATLDGTHLSGTWIKNDKSRTLPFTATQY